MWCKISLLNRREEVSLLQSFIAHSEKLPFLTLIFPSWRFFSKPQVTPEIFDRTEGKMPFTPPKYRWWNLFFNPHGNRYLAQRDMLDRFLVEIQTNSPQQIPELISYKMVLRFITQQKRLKEIKPEHISFQIRDHEDIYFDHDIFLKRENP